jgi:hypothetical protein
MQWRTHEGGSIGGFKLTVEAARSTVSSTTCLDAPEMERREGAKRRGRRRGLG